VTLAVHGPHGHIGQLSRRDVLSRLAGQGDDTPG
jgi:hypothetical protein